MTDYSLYCNVSNIAIRPNNKCVIIPLHRTFYGKYAVSCLPIYGTFSGYGALLNIQQDNNTKLIESHYSQSIDDFVKCILNHDAYKTPNRRIDVDGFMAIDKEVFDIMVNEYHYNKKQPFGNKTVLDFLNFKFIKHLPKDPTFGNIYKWSKNNIEVYSNTESLYDKDYNELSIDDIKHDTNIDNEKLEYLNQPFPKIWQMFKDDHNLMDVWFSSTLGYGFYYKEQFDLQKINNTLGGYQYVIDKFDTRTREEHLSGIRPNKYLPYKPYDEYTDAEKDIHDNNRMQDVHRAKIKLHFSIIKKYLDDLDTYGDEIAKLSIMASNMQCISKSFELQKQNVTPRYGDYKAYKKLYNEFINLNNQYIGTSDGCWEHT